MAISGVNPKCYILALFVRDDGTRFLLGEDPFEFKDNQLHFQQNTMANDVVEVQGNDGYLLAGQVRRPGTQMFDGYVCNGTNSKEEVEVKRRSFLQFFRRSHFYKVIYVFPNGTAIQRKQGFLVDDPTVQELYQQYPEYHVALNFEDVNYYTYEEDDQGHEIYAKEAIVALARGGATGGLIWDSYGVVWEGSWSLPLSISGVQFQILNNAGARAPIENVELYGDTYQQTYSGKNLVDLVPATNTMPDKTQSATFETVYEATLGRNVLHASGSGAYPYIGFTLPNRLTSGKYYAFMIKYRTLTTTTGEVSSDAKNFRMYPGRNNLYSNNISTGTERIKDESGANNIRLYDTQTYLTRCIRFYADPDVYDETSTPAWYTGFSISWVPAGVSGNISAKEIWIADIQIYEISQTDWDSNNYTGTDFEKYTGGIPAPSPSYPMPIRVVTGEQTVTVSDGIDSEDFVISLGSLELCKIGNYQDYVYKSGDDWYVHKGIGKANLGDFTWKNNTTGTSGVYRLYSSDLSGLFVPPPDNNTPGVGISNYFVMKPNSWYGPYGSVVSIAYNLDGVNINAYHPDYNTSSSASGFKTWCSNNNVTLYYALTTPTDTKITDATLVGQLEALGAMKLFIGENNGLVSATGPNLPATLAFDYYTKFTTIGAEWEEGGTKGATIVNVDAIDNTYPVWELTGPATNPTLSVLTTNTTLTYNGTITTSQKLVIDMFNKTATLNGTSVIGNVSGDFVYMAPGTNRVAYTAGNTDAPDSTIYWQEVVG